MKKILTLSASVLLSVSAIGQLKIGPMIGFNNTRFVYKGNTGYLRSDRFDVVPDFRLGVLADVSLNRVLSFQPALLYARNSQRWNEFYNSTRQEWLSIGTLELPLSLTLKPERVSGNRFFGSGGLVPMLILGGRTKLSNYNRTNFVNQTIVSMSDNYTTAAMAVKGEVGYETKKGFALRIYAQRGVTNLWINNTSSLTSMTYFNYGLGLSCFLNSGHSKKAADKKATKLERKKNVVRDAPRFRKQTK